MDKEQTETIRDCNGRWFAEKDKNNWNFFGRQEDGSYGLVNNGLTLEDVMDYVEGEATWDKMGRCFTFRIVEVKE